MTGSGAVFDECVDARHPCYGRFMLGRGPVQAARGALLLSAGLACERTSLEAKLTADAGVSAPEPSPDAGAAPPPADATAEVSSWVASCRQNLANAGLGAHGTEWSLAIGGEGTVYLGGDFTWAGPLTGGGVPFVLPEG
jgi:hypothetical protein